MKWEVYGSEALLSAIDSRAQVDGIIGLPPHRMSRAPIWRVAVSITGLTAVASAIWIAPVATAVALALAGFGLPALALVWARPEIGLIALLALSSGLVAPDIVDVRLPFGGLDLRDLLLGGMIGLLFLRRRFVGNAESTWRVLGGPLLLFISLAVYSALYAILYGNVERNAALAELRPLVYYSTFFIAVWALTRRAQIVLLMAMMFIVADVTAAVIIVQQFLGQGTFLLGVMAQGSWLIWQQGDWGAAFGSVRVIPPDHVLVYVMAIVAFALMLFPRFGLLLRGAFGLQFLFLNVGLLLTYTRSQWLASAVALSALCLLLPRPDKVALVRVLALAMMLSLVLVLGGASVLTRWESSPTVRMLGERASSILTPQETLETDSLVWRSFETEEALRSISQHPLLGVGLGNAYRNVTTLGYEADRVQSRFTQFVHDSYLYIAVKMGIPGLLAFVWCCLAFLIATWKSYWEMGDGLSRRLVMVMFASFLGVLLWSAFMSTLMQVESAVALGLTTGLSFRLRHIELLSARSHSIRL